MKLTVSHFQNYKTHELILLSELENWFEETRFKFVVQYNRSPSFRKT